MPLGRLQKKWAGIVAEYPHTAAQNPGVAAALESAFYRGAREALAEVTEDVDQADEVIRELIDEINTRAALQEGPVAGHG